MLVLLDSLDSKKDRRSVGFIVEIGNRLLLLCWTLHFSFLTTLSYSQPTDDDEKGLVLSLAGIDVVFGSFRAQFDRCRRGVAGVGWRTDAATEGC
jgi:hypothetical protein